MRQNATPHAAPVPASGPSTIPSATREELRQALRRAGASVFLNLALAAAKGVAGVAAGSAALISDALHSATDVFASLAALAGLYLASKDHPSFPFGLYKAENVATLVIAFLVMLAGYEIGRHALLAELTPPDVSIGLPVALASLVVATAFGLYQVRMGKRYNSPALVADGRDYLADSASTMVVVLSFLGHLAGFAVERYAALVVAVFIVASGAKLVLSALKDLLDAAVDPATQREIEAMVLRHPQVKRVERMLTRGAGGRMIVNLDVLMRTDSHELADRAADHLEEAIQAAFPGVVMVHIRTHYGHEAEQVRATPVQGPGKPMAKGLAQAPWYFLETLSPDGTVLAGEYLENPHAGQGRRKGFAVARWLLAKDVDELRIPSVSRAELEGGGRGGVLFLLQELGVRVVSVEEEETRG